MASQTGPKMARSNSCKGPVYPGKGPNENFGASKCDLGPNFWNLAPRVPTCQPWIKTFSDGPRNSMWCKWLDTTIVTITIGRKVRFYKRYPLWWNKGAVRLRQPWDCTIIRDYWYQCCHFWFNMTSDVMFSDKFLMSDVLSTNVMLTGLLFSFHISSHFRTQIS